MASRVELPALPLWLASIPTVFNPAVRTDLDQILNCSLAAASGVLAADSEKRDCCSRICFLLAELAAQYGRRTGDCTRPIPVTRAELARAAGLSLTPVKRILGFLSLSRVVEETSAGLRVIDCQRLCKLASYERTWLPNPISDEEEDALLVQENVPAMSIGLTLAGDQASFV